MLSLIDASKTIRQAAASVAADRSRSFSVRRRAFLSAFSALLKRSRNRDSKTSSASSCAVASRQTAKATSVANCLAGGNRLIGVVSEFGKYRTLSRWHCCLARKRSFLRSRRENAGRASAGLVRPILENRSRIEPPRLPGFENSRNAASSSRRHAQSRAAA